MICDHDTNRGFLAFKEILSTHDDFILIPGMEITTKRGEIMGAWIDEHPGTSEFPGVVDRIKEQYGMVIVPHPFDKMKGSAMKPSDTDKKYFDAVEVLNSRCIRQSGNKKALEYAKKHSLLKSAGSDAHFESEIGTAWMSFNGDTIDEFQQAFRNGETEYGGKTSPYSLLSHIVAYRIRRSLKR
jgi:predicted metal-dependent phosphoesterase TrpH